MGSPFPCCARRQTWTCRPCHDASSLCTNFFAVSFRCRSLLALERTLQTAGAPARRHAGDEGFVSCNRVQAVQAAWPGTQDEAGRMRRQSDGRTPDARPQPAPSPILFFSPSVPSLQTHTHTTRHTATHQLAEHSAVWRAHFVFDLFLSLLAASVFFLWDRGTIS